MYCLLQFIFLVQNSQASDPTVAKLLEVDADLAAQEVELTLQLQSIQEKRHSLKNARLLMDSRDLELEDWSKGYNTLNSRRSRYSSP